MDGREILASLVAGGVAGLCADLTLFPLDTIKTRLQSPQGLYNGGGFRGIYAGIPSTALGSFPNAALFFVTYEYTKSVLGSSVSTKKAPLVHMIAASLGEVVSCMVRVPSEVVKQRAQACPSLGTYKVFIDTVRHEGILGLYRGYGSTVKRENKIHRYYSPAQLSRMKGSKEVKRQETGDHQSGINEKVSQGAGHGKGDQEKVPRVRQKEVPEEGSRPRISKTLHGLGMREDLD
ncbi:S-adenosylmethionine mitochondrial carrier protein isoform X2 [Scyliorhinus canicula]|uniref:S-adenosylmethionine mitochondrial carrier protein isoform X2 n=1 Tax=Scyliorhinus canicula TaxID=7830 RepID=UPI0018F72FA9|nr:S-adenosylmethionine mitochondrial carrier protein isoform X2 [Scyliorhinus canicula]